MTTEDFRLPPLTKNNYQRWKYEVRFCLKSIGATGHVDGTVKCPTEPGREKDVEIWMKTDGKAQRVLTCALSDDDHAAIRDCDTSRDVWLKILSIYETKTNENKYLLNQEFHRMRFNDGQSIASYCAQLTVIRQKLKALGKELSDSGLVAKLINDLPPRFDNFRSTYYIQAALGIVLTFDKLKEQLMLVKANVSSTATNTDTGDALVTQAKNKADTNPKKREKRTCFHCKKISHIKRDCRKWKAEQIKEQSAASVASGQAFVTAS
ncbi:copia protein [Lasius niger]|uniref:Copia protein n=1 Tax=Lasius niger TaxID=67767 RepID=A0A0J7K737_LASNI|nr:copia protein [Lasius niger]